MVRSKPHLKFAVCAALVAITWVIFGQTLGHQFVNYDDLLYVVENQHIRAGLSWHGILWALTQVHSQNWHPLTSMSHMLHCQLFGLQPGWHHFVNVLLHSAGAVLLFLALQQMTGALWPSAFAAANSCAARRSRTESRKLKRRSGHPRAHLLDARVRNPANLYIH